MGWQLRGETSTDHLRERRFSPKIAYSNRALEAYRVTTPLCTLRDVAENHLSEHLLQQAVGEALERGLVRRKVLAAVVPMLAEHGQMRLRQALESASQSSFASVP